MTFVPRKARKAFIPLLLFSLGFLAFAAIFLGCSGSTTTMTSSNMGMVNVSISDPPSCMAPQGSFMHVYVTVRSVQAHTSASATDSTPGWQELAPQLATQPMQIDLFAPAQTNCVLAQLGSAQLPVGNYQQIRLLLVSNTPAASDAVPMQNACAGHGFNCVVLGDGSVHQLDLSSQANTGLKIPPGQVLGGPIQVQAGQSVDLNIDFNACASIVQEGNGAYRLKPALTASQVGPNNSGISGQVVDSITKTPINGKTLVAVEQADSTGTERIIMQTATDSNGKFRFCPLPVGPFDVVAVAVGPANLPYNATAILNVPNGTSLGTIPLVAETGALAPAILQGFVTATNAGTPAQIDVSFSALQVITVSGGANRALNIPLQTIPSTSTAPEVDSTSPLSVTNATNCPTGSPANANCAQYSLVVPASNPNVGVFSSGGVSYSAPAAGDVLFTVDAIAAAPMSGGAPSCTPPEIPTSNDINGMPLRVSPATTTQVARIDFSGCS
jgi:Domain of unknown function (DUF4382)/Carboxypeptidase regulatory-like domain